MFYRSQNFKVALFSTKLFALVIEMVRVCNVFGKNISGTMLKLFIKE